MIAYVRGNRHDLSHAEHARSAGKTLGLVKQTTLWLFIIAGVVLMAYGLYQFRHSKTNLNVEPQATEEIEKAKRQ
jgi:sulfite exporter TauE/SafE